MADSTPTGTRSAAPSDVRGRRWRRLAIAAAATVLALTLLALFVGWQGGSSDSPAGGTADEASAGRAAMGTGAEQSQAEQSQDAGSMEAFGAELSESSGAAPAENADVSPELVDRAVIRTGSLSLTSEDGADARREVVNAVTALGGYVADEQSTANDSGDLQRTDITVQVPTDSFATAVERFKTAGTEVGYTSSTRDVTEQVVDVDTRVANAQASLRRIRLLLGRAASLGDVIRLEQVLSSRQADLESLLAQQQSLAARTDLATVQVTIALPPKNTPPVEEKEEATGFLAGLSRGWDALATGYVTLATALGTALPTLIVLGLLALLARLVARRLRRSPAPSNAGA